MWIFDSDFFSVTLTIKNMTQALINDVTKLLDIFSTASVTNFSLGSLMNVLPKFYIDNHESSALNSPYLRNIREPHR